MDPRDPPHPAAHSPSLHPSLFPLSVWPFYVKLNPTTTATGLLLFASSEIICRRPIVLRCPLPPPSPPLFPCAIYYYPLLSIACLFAIQLSEPELRFLSALSYSPMLHLTIQLSQILSKLSLKFPKKFQYRVYIHFLT